MASNKRVVRCRIQCRRALYFVSLILKYVNVVINKSKHEINLMNVIMSTALFAGKIKTVEVETKHTCRGYVKKRKRSLVGVRFIKM